MGARTASSSRTAPSAGAVSIDVVLIVSHERRLYVFTESTGTGRRRLPALPWGTAGKAEHLDAAAARIAQRAVGFVPPWIEQAGAFGAGTAHPGGASVSVCYVGVLPWADAPWSPSWKDAAALSGLAERHRRMVSTARSVVRTRLEQAPIAFSMLPREFTLSELQQAYETVLARRLHKASFRRSLQAAFLVEPTGEWRSEGRGRPAQLYRHAPRRRKGARRGVRLDLL
jgi:8-oxo-dGTP diphosphatase